MGWMSELKIGEKLKNYNSLVMFSNTLFSLPFTILSMVWAADGLPSFRVVIWILIALFGGRNGANAINKIIDKKFDALDKRTASRVLVRGIVTVKEAWALTILCFGLYFLGAFMLGPLCFALSPIPFVLFCFYSFSKRFTLLCHLILGIAIAGAPLGAWIAVQNSISAPPLLLTAAVCFWVAGFDTVYAIQDITFDRSQKLHSLPVFFGRNGGIIIASVLFAAASCFLAVLPQLINLGTFYFIGLASFILLLTAEICFSIKKNVSVNFYAYTINQMVSIIFVFFALLDFIF